MDPSIPKSVNIKSVKRKQQHKIRPRTDICRYRKWDFLRQINFVLGKNKGDKPPSRLMKQDRRQTGSGQKSLLQLQMQILKIDMISWKINIFVSWDGVLWIVQARQPQSRMTLDSTRFPGSLVCWDYRQ